MHHNLPNNTSVQHSAPSHLPVNNNLAATNNLPANHEPFNSNGNHSANKNITANPHAQEKSIANVPTIPSHDHLKSKVEAVPSRNLNEVPQDVVGSSAHPQSVPAHIQQKNHIPQTEHPSPMHEHHLSNEKNTSHSSTPLDKTKIEHSSSVSPHNNDLTVKDQTHEIKKKVIRKKVHNPSEVAHKPNVYSSEDIKGS